MEIRLEKETLQGVDAKKNTPNNMCKKKPSRADGVEKQIKTPRSPHH